MILSSSKSMARHGRLSKICLTNRPWEHSRKFMKWQKGIHKKWTKMQSVFFSIIRSERCTLSFYYCYIIWHVLALKLIESNGTLKFHPLPFMYTTIQKSQIFLSNFELEVRKMMIFIKKKRAMENSLHQHRLGAKFIDMSFSRDDGSRKP